MTHCVALILLGAGDSNRFKKYKVPKKQWLRVGDIPLWLKVAQEVSNYYPFSKLILSAKEEELQYMQKYLDSLVFNESEYFNLYNNPYSWNISKQMHDFTFRTCLFIGVSLTDPNMKRLLEVSINPLKFNFIFMKKENGYNENTYRTVTNYFFSYDLITIWIDNYDEIGKWLELI